MTTGSSLGKRLAGYAILVAIALLFVRIFDTEKHADWGLMVPFLSGAANYELGKGWRFNEADIATFSALPSREAQQNYRFEPSDESTLEPYNFSSRGFLFVVLAARTLFPWQGDLQATESLQAAVHILISILMISLLSSPTSRALFFVLYTVNPLILMVTTAPYYYFWQVVPSACLLPMLWDRDLRYGRWLVAIAVILAASYAIRPTTLFPAMFFFALAFLRDSKPLAVGALVLYFVLAIPVFGGNLASKDPWHTAYIGLGAWPNPHVPAFEDTFAFVLYEEEHGERVRVGAGGNYRDPEVRAEMSRLARDAYMEIAREEPLMIVRNAALNFFQSYSVGYISDSQLLSYASALIGLGTIGVLLFFGKFAFLIAIGLSTIATVPLAPPNHVYGFSNYLLLVGAFIHLVRQFGVSDRVDAFIHARMPNRG